MRFRKKWVFSARLLVSECERLPWVTHSSLSSQVLSGLAPQNHQNWGLWVSQSCCQAWSRVVNAGSAISSAHQSANCVFAVALALLFYFFLIFFSLISIVFLAYLLTCKTQQIAGDLPALGVSVPWSCGNPTRRWTWGCGVVPGSLVCCGKPYTDFVGLGTAACPSASACGGIGWNPVTKP